MNITRTVTATIEAKNISVELQASGFFLRAHKKGWSDTVWLEYEQIDSLITMLTVVRDKRAEYLK